MPSTSPAFVVIAEFEVSLDHREEFLAVCVFDSERSLADEPGCRQFDVSTLPESPGMVVLYEIYDDRAAFDAHMTTPHLKKFADELVRLNVRTVQVRFFGRHHP